MGGAAVIFDTVSHGSLQSGLISGLRPHGQLIVASQGGTAASRPTAKTR